MQFMSKLKELGLLEPNFTGESDCKNKSGI